jgi:hypothetical protein
MALAALCFGCGRDDYVGPIVTHPDLREVDYSDLIEYRALTRGDFKATAKPPAVADHPFAAVSIGMIRVCPEMNWFIRPQNADSTMFVATPRNLCFRAVLNRNESWWSTEPSGYTVEYILQHEQIHFAILELEARSMNRRLSEIEPRLKSVGRTRWDVGLAAHARLMEEISTAVVTAIERNTEFEKDCSSGRNPKRQAQWWDRVQAELVASTPGRWVSSRGESR